MENGLGNGNEGVYNLRNATAQTSNTGVYLQWTATENNHYPTELASSSFPTDECNINQHLHWTPLISIVSMIPATFTECVHTCTNQVFINDTTAVCQLYIFWEHNTAAKPDSHVQFHTDTSRSHNIKNHHINCSCRHLVRSVVRVRYTH